MPTDRSLPALDMPVDSYPVLEANRMGPLYQAGGLERWVKRWVCCSAGAEERYRGEEGKEEEIYPR